jgi:hypothetical protein
MNAFNQGLEVAASIIFLIIGLWGTAFAYELVGPKLVGRFRWRPEFQRPLRWLGPLLVLACVASLIMLFRLGSMRREIQSANMKGCIAAERAGHLFHRGGASA